MDRHHPFRFGIQMAAGASREEWQSKARRAEALGYDTLVMPDHPGLHFAYGPALAAAALATATLRIGTLILATDFRPPVAIASEAATLDLLSDGRFELGLGTGGSLLADYERTGVPFESPGVRVNRFAESLHAIKLLFGEAPVTYAGQYVRITELTGFPRPIQGPHPPILVGAGGRRMLALAAREADIVSILPSMSATAQFNLTELRADVMEAKIESIRQAAGERFGGIELHCHLQCLAVTVDWRQVATPVATRWGMTEEEVRESPYTLLGTRDEIVTLLRVRRARFGISYFTVPERDMETFAPVIARIAEE